MRTKPSSVSGLDIQLREMCFSVRPHGGAKTNENPCAKEAPVTVLHPDDESHFDFLYTQSTLKPCLQQITFYTLTNHFIENASRKENRLRLLIKLP